MSEPTPPGTPLHLGADVDLAVLYEPARSIFKRHGVEITNNSDFDIHDLCVSPLGAKLFGIRFLGSPVVVLPAGQRLTFYMEPPAPADADLRLRVTGTTPQGEPFLYDMTVRR